MESKKFIGRTNEDEVNDGASLNNNGISALHDSNIHCLSAQEENKGLADYNQLLDQVLPRAKYGASGDDTKGQSFVKRTRSGKQSTASISVARNVFQRRRKTLSFASESQN